MALAAVNSLYNTLNRLQDSSRFSLVPPSPNILNFAYKQVEFFAKSVYRSNMSRFRDGIIGAVLELEEIIESHVSKQNRSQSKSHPLLFSLVDIEQDIYSFSRRVKKMEAEYINDLRSTLPSEKADEMEEKYINELRNTLPQEEANSMGEYINQLWNTRPQEKADEIEEMYINQLRSTWPQEEADEMEEEHTINELQNNLPQEKADEIEEMYINELRNTWPQEEADEMEEEHTINELQNNLPQEKADEIEEMYINELRNTWPQEEADEMEEEHTNELQNTLPQKKPDEIEKMYVNELRNTWPQEEADEIEEMYINELWNTLPQEEDDNAVQKSNMVGLFDQYNEVKHKLELHQTTDQLKVVSLVGMPGIGKTTLAKKVFEDPDIVKCFDCRVWVTIAQKKELEEIPGCILAQLNHDNHQRLEKIDDENIHWNLKERLKGTRYLIVLDDVWDKHMSHHLQPSYQKQRNELKILLPDEENGSRVLLTTRLHQVDTFNGKISSELVLIMRLLNKEESRDLLFEKVFGENHYHPQLEKAGQKIAEHCDGLPLTIVKVANLLSKAVKTSQYWSEVATQKNHQLFTDAYDEVLKVLLPSYYNLPQHLKEHFLYMGVFPQYCEVPRSKLINMWNTDGFLEQYSFDAMECLEELVSNSLVIAYQNTIDTSAQIFLKQIKTWGLHSSLWRLSTRVASKTNFSYVLNTRDDGVGRGRLKKCRLSFHNNTLFAIKEVHKLVEDNCASRAQSLLCYGPYHQYQVPIYFGLKSLRQLDALRIRFYEFPMEVIQLRELRYLALTVNGSLSPSIYELKNLQFLILGRHLSIKSCSGPSYLPVEIWNMKELKHLEVMGSDLPASFGTSSLQSLLTLSNVSAESCIESVLTAIPNLQKLGIQIELASDNDGRPLSCFDYISHLKRLKSLKCVVVNPTVVPPLAPLSIIPSHLTKLSLSGLGYSWDDMSKIASLRHLKVLKLRNYAFQGPKWEIEDRRFSSLLSLAIEDTDLVEWKIGCRTFPRLKYLNIKNCYKLEKIHVPFLFCVEKIKLVDCNPLCVEQMKVATIETKVEVHCSWNHGARDITDKTHFIEKEKDLPIFK